MSDDALQDEIAFVEDGRRVALTLDEELYPRDAILGAAYLFVDRAWVFLSRPGDRQVEVRLKPKGDTDSAALEALAGEFANELLNQVLRVRIGESTGRIREYYMARAFFSTTTQSSIDQLLAELDEEELADDDLEISVPWDTPEPAADTPDEGPAVGDEEPPRA
ncbi:MAG: His-Xaa-Ser system protein HxsD [Deltaproteobacteria bacterium]|nr:MAG: His-Xaa-Ser system protein HxsD [Deltaproteobacteria bacterium]